MVECSREAEGAMRLLDDVSLASQDWLIIDSVQTSTSARQASKGSGGNAVKRVYVFSFCFPRPVSLS